MTERGSMVQQWWDGEIDDIFTLVSRSGIETQEEAMDFVGTLGRVIARNTYNARA